MLTGTYDQLRAKPTVEADETLVPEYLAHTVETILVQQLSDNVAPLILHTAYVGRCQIVAVTWISGGNTYRVYRSCRRHRQEQFIAPSNINLTLTVEHISG